METRSPARRAIRLSELSLPRQRLVRLCQAISYGALQELQIREREPVFDPPPRLLADVKLDRDSAARPEIALVDFVLRDEVIALMDHLDRLVDTTVECLEVHAGIPRRARFTLSPAESPVFLGSIRSPR